VPALLSIALAIAAFVAGQRSTSSPALDRRAVAASSSSPALAATVLPPSATAAKAPADLLPEAPVEALPRAPALKAVSPVRHTPVAATPAPHHAAPLAMPRSLDTAPTGRTAADEAPAARGPTDGEPGDGNRDESAAVGPVPSNAPPPIDPLVKAIRDDITEDESRGR